VPDLQSGGCWFESRPGLLRTKVYSAFHPSGVGKWVPAAAGEAKAGMVHSDCGWTCGCAGKTVRSLENTCHTWALLWWWFTMKRRYIKPMHLYLCFTFTKMKCLDKRSLILLLLLLIIIIIIANHRHCRLALQSRVHAVWHSGSALVSISEVTVRRARLVLGWATVSIHNQPPRPTQSSIHRDQ